MSPAIVTYINLPRRVEPPVDTGAVAGRGGLNPPLTINIPTYPPLRLTGHLASAHFQGMVAKLLGGSPFPGDPPVRQEEEERAGDGEGQGDVNANGPDRPRPGALNIPSGGSGFQGDVNGGRRWVRNNPRNAAQNAKRLAARQEYLTNPEAAQARRSARLAHKEFINYNDDDYYVGLRYAFNR
jgi:hypothetical protein